MGYKEYFESMKVLELNKHIFIFHYSGWKIF